MGMGHKRAMTLPHLGAGLGRDGLPVPLSAGGGGGEGGLVVEEDVPGAFYLALSSSSEIEGGIDVMMVRDAGLPGRARLSRPADSLTPSLGPSPSSVFHSSHGRPSTSTGPKRSTTMSLLPSMAVKAIDKQRQGLVAYEYLCHLAECVSPLPPLPFLLGLELTHGEDVERATGSKRTSRLSLPPPRCGTQTTPSTISSSPSATGMRSRTWRGVWEGRGVRVRFITCVPLPRLSRERRRWDRADGEESMGSRTP